MSINCWAMTVNALRLSGNWFWQVGSVAHRFLARNESIGLYFREVPYIIHIHTHTHIHSMCAVIIDVEYVIIIACIW